MMKHDHKGPTRTLRALLAALCIAAALWGGACQKQLDKLPKPSFLRKKRGVPTKIAFRIESRPHTNGGRSFYVMFRTVTEQEFVTDDYNKIASMVFAKPVDPTVLNTFAIIPGVASQVSIPNDTKNPIGLYCLFTEPDQHWKMMFPQPVQRGYKVVLERNTIRQQ